MTTFESIILIAIIRSTDIITEVSFCEINMISWEKIYKFGAMSNSTRNDKI